MPTDDDDAQGLFDFDTGNTNGFDNWRRQREARLQSIRREWAVPVGKRVCLKLREFDHEFVGILMLAEEPQKIDRRLPLLLKIHNLPLGLADIEHCTVLD
ncbi:MAG: hypothetical protein NTW21_06285 [Verrucomicrobia bacterium]|nr:hypothetical protein [Verrucomicrobiota bacterium]